MVIDWKSAKLLNNAQNTENSAELHLNLQSNVVSPPVSPPFAESNDLIDLLDAGENPFPQHSKAQQLNSADHTPLHNHQEPLIQEFNRDGSPTNITSFAPHATNQTACDQPLPSISNHQDTLNLQPASNRTRSEILCFRQTKTEPLPTFDGTDPELWISFQAIYEQRDDSFKIY